MTQIVGDIWHAFHPLLPKSPPHANGSTIKPWWKGLLSSEASSPAYPRWTPVLSRMWELLPDVLLEVESHRIGWENISLALTLGRSNGFLQCLVERLADRPHFQSFLSLHKAHISRTYLPIFPKLHCSFHRRHLEKYNVPNCKLQIMSLVVYISLMPTLSGQ